MWISITADGHDAAGNNLYTGPRIARPGLDTLKALAFTGDFEGQVTFAFALRHRAEHRVFYRSPSRWSSTSGTAELAGEQRRVVLGHELGAGLAPRARAQLAPARPHQRPVPVAGHGLDGTAQPGRGLRVVEQPGLEGAYDAGCTAGTRRDDGQAGRGGLTQRVAARLLLAGVDEQVE